MPATASRSAPLRQQQLFLDRVGQSLALIGAATVERRAAVVTRATLFGERSNPTDADRHRHPESARDIGSTTKPVRRDGEEQHGPAAERGATDEPRRQPQRYGALRQTRLRGRGVEHPAGRHHRAVAQRGILHGLLQCFDSALDGCPLGDHVAQLACARCWRPPRAVQSASTGPRRRPAASRCAPAGRRREHSTARRAARPGTRGRSRSGPSRRRTASASSGAVRVRISSSEPAGSIVKLLRKSSGVIVSPRRAVVLVATVRVSSRLTLVAMARVGSTSGS